MDTYFVTPPSANDDTTVVANYRNELTRAARASEEAGWSGILVPHNLHELDPWIVAGHLGSVTNGLIPLLALQPACTPPHLAAACAAAYAALYGRPIHFNLVSGAREDEMRRIGDDLSHDERYDRLLDYGTVLRKLLHGEPVDLESQYYTYRGFELKPHLPVLAQCRIFIAGSSPASMKVATEIADVIVTHPAPYAEWRETFLEPLRATGYARGLGVRMGILARPSADEAWKTARDRFPETWIGRQETLLKTRSQNAWSRQLAERAVAEEPDPGGEPDPYWLGAFRTGQASAPFLVGDYETVGERLAEYRRDGVGALLLNGCHEDDFEHIQRVLVHSGQ